VRKKKRKKENIKEGVFIDRRRHYKYVIW